MNYQLARFRFNIHILFLYAKVNIGLIRNFFLRNTLVSIIFFIEWVIGNLIWYYIAVMNWGWLSWFARVWLAFLWSPLAIEKAIYIVIAIWLSKKIIKVRNKMKGEW